MESSEGSTVRKICFASEMNPKALVEEVMHNFDSSSYESSEKFIQEESGLIVLNDLGQKEFMYEPVALENCRYRQYKPDIEHHANRDDPVVKEFPA
jgi:hypothetical protein